MCGDGDGGGDSGLCVCITHLFSVSMGSIKVD